MIRPHEKRVVWEQWYFKFVLATAIAVAGNGTTMSVRNERQNNFETQVFLDSLILEGFQAAKDGNVLSKVDFSNFIATPCSG